MAVLLGGGLCTIGAMLIGLAYHNTYAQAWDILAGITPPTTTTTQPPVNPTPQTQQTPYTQSNGVA